MIKKALHSVTFAATVFVLSGCAYLKDRARDAADILTLSYEETIGAKGRVGPLSIGLLAGGESRGLRGGALTATKDAKSNDLNDQGDIGFLFGGYENFNPTDKWASLRHKGYTASGALIWGAEDIIDQDRTHWPYYTEVEAVVGFGAGLRVGVNFGEFFDFLVGFVGVDLYDDDVWESLDERVALTVVDIDGNPVEDVGCVIDGRTYRSDSGGQIVSTRLKGDRVIIRMRRGGRFFVHDRYNVAGGTVEVGVEDLVYQLSGPPGPIRRR
ncbi:MAG: hypothetical protein AAF196_11195 [Planctomycetota bacterium]